MRTIILLMSTLGLLAACGQPSASDEAAYLRLSQKIPLLVKTESLKDQFTLTRKGITLYATPEDLVRKRPEVRIYPSEYPFFQQLVSTLPPDSLLAIYQRKGVAKWTEAEYQKLLAPYGSVGTPSDSSGPLAGVRIALDPGHSAANPEIAEVEGKYVKVRAKEAGTTSTISFHEASLTLATALALREKLEADGATVLMTRTLPGATALNIDWPTWRTTSFESGISEALEAKLIDSAQANWFRTEASEKEIFGNLFNRLDLVARAKMINAFNPHMTLILHYNIDPANWEKKDDDGYYGIGKENYCMAFVPGSFMQGELRKPEDRLAFLRLLLTDDLENSAALSHEVVDRFQAILGVPAVLPERPLRYLQNACIRIPETHGVFARNLTLTRMIRGPLCYGESLCQDNRSEALALNRQDAQVQGMKTSARVLEVADAYYEGIRRYVNKKKD